MIRQLHDKPHVLWQKESDAAQAEEAIAMHADDCIITLMQGEDVIHVNKGSVPELCKLLKKLAASGEAQK